MSVNTQKEIESKKETKKLFSREQTYTIEEEKNNKQKTLYLKNVPPKTTKRDFIKIFESFFDCQKEHKTELEKQIKIDIFTYGYLKGTAFIEFPNPSFAVIARKVLHKMVIKNNVIFADFKRNK